MRKIDRFLQYLDYMDITENKATIECKLSQGLLHQAKSGKSDLGYKTIDKILDKYQDINRAWLLTGEGEMLKSEEKAQNDNPPQADNDMNIISTGKVIPYYDAEAAAGTSYGMEMAPSRPAGLIEIGGLMKDSEFAIRVYGNSMTPNYPAGCVIGLKQYNEHFIEPGTVYVVETAENRYLKRLYYNKDKTHFRCISDNTMKYESGPMEGEYFYQEFEIPLEDVRRLLRVTGVIKRNIL